MASTLFWRKSMLRRATTLGPYPAGMWHQQVVKWLLRYAGPSNCRRWISNVFNVHNICTPTPSSHHCQVDCSPVRSYLCNARQHICAPADGRQLHTVSTWNHRKAWRFATVGGNRFDLCWVSRIILTWRRCGVKVMPTYDRRDRIPNPDRVPGFLALHGHFRRLYGTNYIAELCESDIR